MRVDRARRTALSALAALAVAGCADTAQGTDPEGEAGPLPSSAAAPETPSCPAAGAAVSAGPVDAATGERAVTLTLVNCGSVPYAVEGHPGIGLLDEQQRPLAVQLIEEPDPIGNGAPGPAAISLAPGDQARAVLLWRNTVELGLDNAEGSFVVVTPGEGEEEQVVPLEVDLGTTGRLTVGPWVPAG